MTLLGFKTILHKKCRSGKNSEGPAENFSKMKTNFKKICYRGPSIDDTYQVSVHLAKRFLRRRLKCERLTDAGCQVMAKAHIAYGNTDNGE
jgi:hypothetical protein